MTGGDLLVVSSNFDLAFGYDDGGSVVPVTLATGADADAIRGGAGVRIASLGGEIAVADAAACGLPETLALVPVRSNETLLRITVRPDGTLSCGEGCEIPLGGTYVDPYGVAVVCRPDDPADPSDDHASARAFVGMLRAPSLQGAMKMIDLKTGEVKTVENLPGKPRAFAYDPLRARLFFTHTDNVTDAPLGWIDFAGNCDPSIPEGRFDGARSGCPRRFIDLLAFVRGVEPHGIALGHPLEGGRRRIYIAARVYDADLAELINARPGVDIGGTLLVLEAAEGALGELEIPFVRNVDVAAVGTSEVEVLPARAPVGGRARRDLVAMTATNAASLFLYDDELGAIVKVLEPRSVADPVTGAPAGTSPVGRAPFALLSRALDAATTRLYVASTGDDRVIPIDIQLEDPNEPVVGAPIRGGAR